VAAGSVILFFICRLTGVEYQINVNFCCR